MNSFKLILRYGNEINCQNKNEAICASSRGDCSTPIGRLMCPKSCGLCKSSCVDTGQHCAIANCDEEESQVACPKTCGYVNFLFIFIILFILFSRWNLTFFPMNLIYYII